MRHPNVGSVDELAQALGVSGVDVRVLLQQAGVPWKRLEGEDVFSRRHLVAAFRSGLVRWDDTEGLAPKYSMAESAERYRRSLPADGSVPF